MVRTIFIKLAKSISTLLLVLHLKCEKLGLCVTTLETNIRKCLNKAVERSAPNSNERHYY